MRFIFLFIFAVILSARINPFEPVIKPGNIIKEKPEYFHKLKVYLPNDARILKKIIFVYQSVSSDIKQKTVDINKNIDFHFPIIVTHNVKSFKKKFFNFKVFKLVLENKSILIFTKDKLLRSFFLVEPFRLVLDFKRKSDFYTIKKTLNSFVKKVIVGSHGNFYRAVIYLDANYNYKIKKLKNGIKIDLY